MKDIKIKMKKKSDKKYFFFNFASLQLSGHLIILDRMLDRMPDKNSENILNIIFKNIINKILNKILKNISNKILKNISENIPNKFFNFFFFPDKISKNISNRISENMSDRMLNQYVK